MLKKIIWLIIGIAFIGFIVIVVINARVPSKSEAIQSFKDNTSVFFSIQDYAEKEEGDLNVDGGILKIKITNPGGNTKIDDEIQKQILFAIRRLSFTAIYESKNYTLFLSRGGAIKQGIMYLKDVEMPTFVYKSEKIMEHWYYIETYAA